MFDITIKKSSKIKLVEKNYNTLNFNEKKEILNTTLSLLSVPNSFEISSNILKQLIDLDYCNQLLNDVLIVKSRLVKWIHIFGSIDSRIFVFGISDNEGIICSLGQATSGIKVIDKDEYSFDRYITTEITENISHFKITDEFKKILITPSIILISLYHKENFPLPRFPLGISDLAHAIRTQGSGNIKLIDMQFNYDLELIIDEIISSKPDIIGISATFGQYDLLNKMLVSLNDYINNDKITIVGGSLSVLNYQELLLDKSVDFVSMGPGEQTLKDVVSYWHGLINKKDITNVALLDYNGEIFFSKKVNNRNSEESIIPELDLLKTTLEHQGVMQLESSRGCSYACSFCPREHKGIWSGENTDSFEKLMPYISDLYEQYPGTDRRIFLVDEEFVGYNAEEYAQGRCISVSKLFKKFNFSYETSSRVDQIVRTKKDRNWHINRMYFWKELRTTGLTKCLFGVESGIDSILKRFNKKVTSQQNVEAIRVITALDVPIRCTYITFDQLMSFEELVATYHFLGRTDLILRPYQGDNYSELYDSLKKDDFVRQQSTNTPFYHLISYMLVSMEGLINSPYLKEAERLGLSGETNLLMGKKEIRYIDSRVEFISKMAQFWIDRNFSLDYLLKSIEKILPASETKLIKPLRVKIKDSAYKLLEIGIKYQSSEYDNGEIKLGLNHLSFAEIKAISNTEEQMFKILDFVFLDLVLQLESEFQNIKYTLSEILKDKVENQISDWKRKLNWTLINDIEKRL